VLSVGERVTVVGAGTRRPYVAWSAESDYRSATPTRMHLAAPTPRRCRSAATTSGDAAALPASPLPSSSRGTVLDEGFEATSSVF
jgi:hypothetical protein